ncbi:tetratricopeptide repeat protein [Thiomicrorhabdus indica]|uniref:tetratricopeptide repeat protein n=1 Tax=Thiomicrorhabdus indica TaxID=2267253 RepID=UPI002AA73A7D|nr:tetratricopeptide repeat protein [Thiomicrorhabdus indica]
MSRMTTETEIQRPSHNFVKKGLWVAVLLFMQGCSNPVVTGPIEPSEVTKNSPNISLSSNPAAQNTQNLKTSEAESENEEPVPAYNAIADNRLNSAQMLKILQAEILLRRGSYESAFELLYGLAKDTSDTKLVKRAFEVSMATYDVEKIRKATDLWKELEPSADLAWRAAFILSLQEGKVEQALQEWDTYQTLSELPMEQDLLVTSRRVAASAPVDAGLVFFEKIVQMHPDVWSGHLGLAMVAATHNMPDFAMEALQEASKLVEKEQKPQIYQLLAKLYVDNSKTQVGIEDLGRYLESFPDDFVVQERMARLQVLAEDYAGAETRYKMILEKLPEAHKARLSLALLQIEQNQLEKAIQNLQPLLDEKGYKAISHYYQGISLQELKRFDEALQSFNQVVTTTFQVDALLHRAEIFFAQGDIDQAYAELEKISVDLPQNKVKRLRAKAIFKSYQEKYQEALDIYNQVLLIEPSNTPVMLAKSYIHFNFGEFEEYESILLKVLELNENNVEALNGLGYFYVERQQKLDKAKVLLSRALELEPNNYFILDSMGWLYYQLQDYAKAVEYLESAFDIEADEEVFAHLIQAYLKNNQTDQAEKLWKTYYNQFKNWESVAKLKQFVPAGFLDD